MTLFFTDMEGFSAMTERLGDQRAHTVLEAHNRIIRRQLARYGGSEVKSQGDGFMVAFQSARRATLCAIAVQRAFTGYAVEHPEEPIRVRIGLHTGETIKEGQDFFGTTVNLAAHIATQARGGEILVSSVLKELTRAAVICTSALHARWLSRACQGCALSSRFPGPATPSHNQTRAALRHRPSSTRR